MTLGKEVTLFSCPVIKCFIPKYDICVCEIHISCIICILIDRVIIRINYLSYEFETKGHFNYVMLGSGQVSC